MTSSDSSLFISRALVFIIFCALNQLTGANAGLRPRKSAGKKIAESGKSFKLSTLIVGTQCASEDIKAESMGRRVKHESCSGYFAALY